MVSTYMVLPSKVDKLIGQDPVVVGGVVETGFVDSVQGQFVEDFECFIRAASFVKRFLSFDKLVGLCQPLGIGNINLLPMFRILLRQGKGFLPLLGLHVQRHDRLEVAYLFVHLIQRQ